MVIRGRRSSTHTSPATQGHRLRREQDIVDDEAAAQAGRPTASTKDSTGPVTSVPQGLRVASEAGWRLIVLGVAVWGVLRILSAVRLAVLALIAALLIAALLQPTVARLNRRGMPRGPAIALTALCSAAVLGAAGWLMARQVRSNFDDLSIRLLASTSHLKRRLLDSPLHLTEPQIDAIGEELKVEMLSGGGEFASAGIEGLAIVTQAVTGTLLTIFCTVFLLYDGPRIWRWTLGMIPASARPAVSEVGPHVWTTLSAYVRGTVAVAFIDALGIGLGLFLLGIPLALPLAGIVFGLAFIPLVGPVASGALAVGVALGTRGGSTALIVLLLVVVVVQVESHILQPFVLGRAIRVHPLAVALSVSVGGLVAGIAGAAVAVPLTAVVNTAVGRLRNAHSTTPAPEDLRRGTVQT
ncbi:AI-2E family transporter [Streptomyces chartreusis]|uniref:AI-2E family transporter n=1 Tax=Streptomyces chartreusis TaxID=1969 RepID=UPI003689800F